MKEILACFQKIEGAVLLLKEIGFDNPMTDEVITNLYFAAAEFKSLTAELDRKRSFS
jgi:hypothetical protein